MPGGRYPIRARFAFAWETALRPSTLERLSAPGDYQRGARALQIRDEADKADYGRELPLTERARAALDSVCPMAGLIFGEHKFAVPLRAAAKAAGIDAHRASKISDYDFRHSRLTHLGTVTSNLSGVSYLAGHRQVTTTNRYMRPLKAAAAEVLAAAAAASPFWPPTGPRGSVEQEQESGSIGESAVVLISARRGTRTPMPCGASPSRQTVAVTVENFKARVRQEASGSTQIAPHSGPGGHQLQALARAVLRGEADGAELARAVLEPTRREERDPT
jgi:hypothetical protein